MLAFIKTGTVTSNFHHHIWQHCWSDYQLVAFFNFFIVKGKGKDNVGSGADLGQASQPAGNAVINLVVGCDLFTRSRLPF